MTVTNVVRLLRRRALLAGVGVIMVAGSAQASPLLVENFDDITTLTGSGWVLTNNSAGLGLTGWFQGETSIFDSQAGAPDAYIAANYRNASDGGYISNWLISPTLTLDNGNTIAFYTRTETGGAAFNDHLELRLSTNGGSADTGGAAGTVGDFTNLLLDINPLFDGSYPESWTLFTATISGLGGPVSGRFAFRYNVPDASVNGDYIGIDTVSVSGDASIAPVPVPEPVTLTMLGLGLAGLNLRRRRAAQSKEHR